jgi:hypothetical protein
MKSFSTSVEGRALRQGCWGFAKANPDQLDGIAAHEQFPQY